jgi:hypothetical protein
MSVLWAIAELRSILPDYEFKVVTAITNPNFFTLSIHLFYKFFQKTTNFGYKSFRFSGSTT